jgi:hypothetical protein
MKNYATNHDDVNWSLSNDDLDFENDEGLNYKTNLNYEYLPNVTNSGFTLTQLSLMENIALEPTQWVQFFYLDVTRTIWTPLSLINVFNNYHNIDFTYENNKIKEFRNRNIYPEKYFIMSINRTKVILKELIEESWHPRRINRYIELGGDIEDLC